MLFLQTTPRHTKIERLRLILSDGQWHSARELARRLGHAFGVAIYHLRHKGRQIVCQLVPGTSRHYRYRLSPKN